MQCVGLGREDEVPGSEKGDRADDEEAHVDHLLEEPPTDRHDGEHDEQRDDGVQHDLR